MDTSTFKITPCDKDPDDSYTPYLYLDYEERTGEIWAVHQSQNGSPIRAWHGHSELFRLGGWPTDEAVEELAATMGPILEPLFEGYESCWDGSNHIARFGDLDRDSIVADVEAALYDFGQVDGHWHRTWDGGEWVASDPSIDRQIEDMTDEEIDAFATELVAEAEAEGYTLTGDLAAYLRERRDDNAEAKQ